jgi:P27 family predicted phage terminase small subunit
MTSKKSVATKRPTAKKSSKFPCRRSPSGLAVARKTRPTLPECPKHLDAEAQAEWRRIVPELAQKGLLKQIDQTAIALYCWQYSRWKRSEREIRAHGDVLELSNGVIAKSPWVRIADRALASMQRFLVQFGLLSARPNGWMYPDEGANVPSVPRRGPSQLDEDLEAQLQEIELRQLAERGQDKERRRTKQKGR